MLHQNAVLFGATFGAIVALQAAPAPVHEGYPAINVCNTPQLRNLLQIKRQNICSVLHGSSDRNDLLKWWQERGAFRIDVSVTLPVVPSVAALVASLTDAVHRMRIESIYLILF